MRNNAVVPALDRFLGRAARMQARWSSDEGFVFNARRGKPVDYRNLRRALASAAGEAGLGHVRPQERQVKAKVYTHAIGSDAEQAARVAEAMRSPDSATRGLM